MTVTTMYTPIERSVMSKLLADGIDTETEPPRAYFETVTAAERWATDELASTEWAVAYVRAKTDELEAHPNVPDRYNALMNPTRVYPSQLMICEEYLEPGDYEAAITTETIEKAERSLGQMEDAAIDRCGYIPGWITTARAGIAKIKAERGESQ